MQCRGFHPTPQSQFSRKTWAQFLGRWPLCQQTQFHAALSYPSIHSTIVGQLSGKTTSGTCLAMSHEEVAQGNLPVCSSHFHAFSYEFSPGLSSAVSPLPNHPTPPPYVPTPYLVYHPPHTRNNRHTPSYYPQ